MKQLGIIFIILSVGILAYVLYANSRYSSVTRTFSPYSLITSSWEFYKKKFINADGRVIDFSQNNITTSEGQSYAMLRSVWVDDKGTFDKVWHWTKTTLKRPDDNLFGWRWGQRSDKIYGFYDNGGNNSAADADTDIALALILANKRWQDSSYLNDAKVILKDIWNVETDTVQNNRFVLAGNWAKQKDTVIINPSYFAPYAYRIFAQVDTEHDWNSLIDPAYDLLNKSGKDPLDTNKAVGLPPDWMALSRSSGTYVKPSDQNLRTTYSYDAVRVPWRIALDYSWNKDERARLYLESSFEYLKNLYQQNGKLASTYAHDGTVVINTENPVMYSTFLGYLQIVDPSAAKKMYEEKILKLYSNELNTFNTDIPYYEQNWLWFGTALYNGFIKNF